MASGLPDTNVLSVQAIQDGTVVSYIHVCAAALLAYDYALTLPQEVALIWPSRLSAVKVLFFLTRYLAVGDLSMLLYLQFASAPSEDECRCVWTVSGWMIIWGVGIGLIIQAVRTWAVWDCGRSVGIILAVTFLGTAGVDCYAFAKFTSSLIFTPMRDVSSVFTRGCLVTGGSHILLTDCAVVVFYDTSSPSSSTLINTLYRDGILFYVYLFGISLANLIVMATARDSLTNVLPALQRTLYSILSSRILLNIRKAAHAKSESDGGASVSRGAQSRADATTQIEFRAMPETLSGEMETGSLGNGDLGSSPRAGGGGPGAA
ncbi:hypothetical protein DENSPDRAFT_881096 [Dentipellis sp. KUC8613]|nr:hypothetical protein DENSPDRAFT_881096 [Dentipellis sp. KUC8613]